MDWVQYIEKLKIAMLCEKNETVNVTSKKVKDQKLPAYKHILDFPSLHTNAFDNRNVKY